MPLLAYIDAGSGSMLLQVILAGALAIPYFFRRVIGDAWNRVRGRGATGGAAEVREENDFHR